MTKNIAYGLLSIPLFLLAGGIWILSSLPDHVLSYAGEGVDPTSVIKTLNFINISDAPGYVAAMGRLDGRDAAKNGVADERDAWDRLHFVGYRFVNNNVLSKCVGELHAKRTAFFDHAVNLPIDGIVPLSDARILIQEAREIPNAALICHDLAVMAQGWKGRLWERVTSR